MGVIASMVFFIFSLCVKLKTLFIGTSLPLYHSFIQEWLLPSPLKVAPLFCVFPPKIHILFVRTFKEKTR